MYLLRKTEMVTAGPSWMIFWPGVSPKSEEKRGPHAPIGHVRFAQNRHGPWVHVVPISFHDLGDPLVQLT
jgi:hypothetical protein